MNPINYTDPDGAVVGEAGALIIGVEAGASTTAISVQIAKLQLQLWGLAGSVASKFVPVLAVTSTAINVTSLGIAIHEYFQTMDYVAQRKPFLDAMTEKSQNALQDALNNNAMNAENAQAGSTAQSGSMGSESTPGDPNKFDFDKNGKTKPRTEPKSLEEKLALDEAKSGQGNRIMQNRINDPKYPANEWAKMEHVHRSPTGTKTTIHYWKNLRTGVLEGFKFK